MITERERERVRMKTIITVTLVQESGTCIKRLMQFTQCKFLVQVSCTGGGLRKTFLYFCRSRSSKVIVFGTNQKRACDFLLVRHSNLGSILHRIGNFAGVFVLLTPPLFQPIFVVCSRWTRQQQDTKGLWDVECCKVSCAATTHKAIMSHENQLLLSSVIGT